MSAISPDLRSWIQRSGLAASCGPVQLAGPLILAIQPTYVDLHCPAMQLS